MTDIDSLPNELLLEIFCYLTFHDCIPTSRVCRLWQTLLISHHRAERYQSWPSTRIGGISPGKGSLAIHRPRIHRLLLPAIESKPYYKLPHFQFRLHIVDDNLISIYGVLFDKYASALTTPKPGCILIRDTQSAMHRQYLGINSIEMDLSDSPMLDELVMALTDANKPPYVVQATLTGGALEAYDVGRVFDSWPFFTIIRSTTIREMLTHIWEYSKEAIAILRLRHDADTPCLMYMALKMPWFIEGQYGMVYLTFDLHPSNRP
ncbi:hypothetical protein ABW21_db0208096 [Orbilia brochopaga]|nr:hypothetical protein ABW21_db0208096 [Drechslerella brochopaga]